VLLLGTYDVSFCVSSPDNLNIPLCITYKLSTSSMNQCALHFTCVVGCFWNTAAAAQASSVYQAARDRVGPGLVSSSWLLYSDVDGSISSPTRSTSDSLLEHINQKDLVIKRLSLWNLEQHILNGGREVFRVSGKVGGETEAATNNP
jgi:hypothetical protein